MYYIVIYFQLKTFSVKMILSCFISSVKLNADIEKTPYIELLLYDSSLTEKHNIIVH